mmetsp:Transcript_4824/g.16636  ORF Transcript_4824/g.16636 Transcript_4824/m.16636 type:complete len:210 (-) Transcript_4824:538-1167(-)
MVYLSVELEAVQKKAVPRLRVASPAPEPRLLPDARDEEASGARKGDAVDKPARRERVERAKRAVPVVRRPETDRAVTGAARDEVGVGDGGDGSDPPARHARALMRPSHGARCPNVLARPSGSGSPVRALHTPVSISPYGQRFLFDVAPQGHRPILHSGHHVRGREEGAAVDGGAVTAEDERAVLGHLPHAHGLVAAARHGTLLAPRMDP